jgi:predicted nucleic acid-binding protein
LVVDTDVLIDYLRDQPQAVVFLEGTEQPLAISAITVAELHAGVLDGEERRRLDAFVAAFEVLPLDRQPAQRAGLWRRQYGPSHGTGLADALIAASAEAAGATLVTLNRRHFPMLAEVLVPSPIFRPL